MAGEFHRHILRQMTLFIIAWNLSRVVAATMNLRDRGQAGRANRQAIHPSLFIFTLKRKE
jgi:hypothetical protein